MIGHKLGLTKNTKYSINQTLEEIGTVSSKQYSPPIEKIKLGITHSPGAPEEYQIIFFLVSNYFIVDDESYFNLFEEGDKALITFDEEYKNTYDYVPPNYVEKQLIDSVLSKHRFISAKKIE